MEELIVALLTAFSGGHLEMEEAVDHPEEQMSWVLAEQCEREDRLVILKKPRQSKCLHQDWNRDGEPSKPACASQHLRCLYRRRLHCHQSLPRYDLGLDVLGMTCANHWLTYGSVAGPEVEVEELLFVAIQSWGSLEQEGVLD